MDALLPRDLINSIVEFLDITTDSNFLPCVGRNSLYKVKKHWMASSKETKVISICEYNMIMTILKTTDFNKQIIRNDLDRYYNQDVSLWKITMRRVNNILHCKDTPAVIINAFDSDGKEHLFLSAYVRQGFLHRIDGPAVETKLSEEYLRYGEYFNPNGPSVNIYNKLVEYKNNDEYHRLDGPAKISIWDYSLKNIVGGWYIEEEYYKNNTLICCDAHTISDRIIDCVEYTDDGGWNDGSISKYYTELMYDDAVFVTNVRRMDISRHLEKHSYYYRTHKLELFAKK